MLIEKPLVSVLISTFNEEKYIEECLLSIYNQSYKNIEVIILDDASTDRTVEVVKQNLRSNDCLIVNPKNLKHHECFNQLLRMASGKYIKIVMADDFLMPTSIEKSVNVLETNHNVTLVAHGKRVVDYRSRKIFDMILSGNSYPINGRTMFLKTLKSGTNIIGEPNSCLFRKNSTSGEYFWNLNIIGAGELALWYKLLNEGDFYYIREPLCGFRISPKSASLIHAGKIAKHFVRFMDYIISQGYQVPTYIYYTGIINAYLKQELRRLIYFYIKLKIKFET